jgi:hypothetical protein
MDTGFYHLLQLYHFLHLLRFTRVYIDACKN